MTTEQKSSKILNIVLWIVQVILAASLIWAACVKLFQEPDKLAAMWPWTKDNTGLVKFTGLIDLLGGLGVLLPSLFRIQPKLTVYAAYGIIVLMIIASVFHIARGEASLIGANVFFAAFAVFIAWGRNKKAPVMAK